MSGILCGSGPRVFPPTFLAPSSQLFCCSRFFFFNETARIFCIPRLASHAAPQKKKKNKKKEKIDTEIDFCAFIMLLSIPFFPSLCMYAFLLVTFYLSAFQF